MNVNDQSIEPKHVWVGYVLLIFLDCPVNCFLIWDNCNTFLKLTILHDTSWSGWFADSHWMKFLDVQDSQSAIFSVVKTMVKTMVSCTFPFCLSWSQSSLVFSSQHDPQTGSMWCKFDRVPELPSKILPPIVFGLGDDSNVFVTARTTGTGTWSPWK